MTTEPTPLAKDQRGAVYVEFLAVFFPLFTMFLGLVQFIFLQTATIIVQQSAMRGARTATVVLFDDPELYGGAQQGMLTPQKRTMVETVARVPLTALGNPANATLSFNKNTYGRNDLLTLTVEYPYACRVPVGRTMACGIDGKRTL
ncbi:MAG TPA: TadE family protein, partial [Candidatus Nanopelagicales bacterium]|nr:TadE family protein [Candidatus Nanopelagicales bacterium]